MRSLISGAGRSCANLGHARPGMFRSSGPAATVLPVLLLALLAVLLAPSPAQAERWLCPDCPDETVERAPGAKELACPACGRTYTVEDLSPPVMYVDARTRDTEIPWVVLPQPDCAIFRLDGLEARDADGALWVPWTLVDWYIPRMRLLKLTDGRELTTDYPKSRERCPDPPGFVFEVTDSTSGISGEMTPFTQEEDASLAELFIVATTAAGRDSARARFIEEVETGKQPRLPRTQPRLTRPAHIPIPSTVPEAQRQGEAVLEARVHEKRGVLAVRLLESSGNAVLDQAALAAARRSFFVPGGEMGVAVPAWIRLRARFSATGGTLTTEPAADGFWRR